MMEESEKSAGVEAPLSEKECMSMRFYLIFMDLQESSPGKHQLFSE